FLGPGDPYHAGRSEALHQERQRALQLRALGRKEVRGIERALQACNAVDRGFGKYLELGRREMRAQRFWHVDQRSGLLAGVTELLEKRRARIAGGWRLGFGQAQSLRTMYTLVSRSSSAVSPGSLTYSSQETVPS